MHNLLPHQTLPMIGFAPPCDISKRNTLVGEPSLSEAMSTFIFWWINSEQQCQWESTQSFLDTCRVLSDIRFNL